MKRKTVLIFALVAILASLTVATVSAAARADLGAVRAATAHFQRSAVAEAAGYVSLVECVELPGVGGMGVHFVNFGLLDLELDPLAPEALVYEPMSNGRMNLVAVEYLVPIDPWDTIYGSDNPPSIFGHELHRNEFLGLYALHVWVWKHNPLGMFEDWNPTVSCGL
jgi:hypothetical protein